MSRLPTVTLMRRRNGAVEEQIVNQLDYANFIGKYVAEGWKIETMTRGDSTDEQVEFAARQTEKEMARSQNPNHEASRDEQRAWEAKQSHTPVAVDIVEEDHSPIQAPETDWRKMKWFALRALVENLSGTRPASKEDAVNYMESREAPVPEASLNINAPN